MSTGTLAPERTAGQHVLPSLLLMASLGLIGWAYHDTFFSIGQKWHSDAAFSHGFLILPISLWLAWRKRDVLAQVTMRPSWLGAVSVLLCMLAWMVARGSGVLVVEQFAVVAMVPAFVLTALGWSATRVLVVPLAFLFFMVPFGRGLVPFLMQVTADFSTLLLQWSGVPVLRSHMYISIPDGSFEVARACSGLNYFVTSLVLGCLYGYLNYRGWLKRAVCVLAFVIFPVVLNGLRVYITILVAHLTNMEYGPGTEHVTFGRIFFVVVMMVLFWIGRRWHDDMPPMVVPAAAPPRTAGGSWLSWWPLPVACVIALSGPPLMARSVAQAQALVTDTASLVALPAPAAGWRGPEEVAGQWRPLYRGGLVERQGRYQAAGKAPVDVFVAVYGLGTAVGAEMISHSNIIDPGERGSLAQETRREVAWGPGGSLEVRELIVGDGAVRQLVWHWYVVGERPVVGPFAAKALEAVAFVTRSARSERIVTLSTPLDDDASSRLEAFLEAHGSCVAKGFAIEACGG